MRISDWSSDVCSSDLEEQNMKRGPQRRGPAKAQAGQPPNEQRRRDRGEQHMMSHAHGKERGGQRAERRDEEEDENRETGPKRTEERRVGTVCGSKGRSGWPHEY